MLPIFDDYCILIFLSIFKLASLIERNSTWRSKFNYLFLIAIISRILSLNMAVLPFRLMSMQASYILPPLKAINIIETMLNTDSRK